MAVSPAWDCVCGIVCEIMHPYIFPPIPQYIAIPTNLLVFMFHFFALGIQLLMHFCLPVIMVLFFSYNDCFMIVFHDLETFEKQSSNPFWFG